MLFNRFFNGKIKTVLKSVEAVKDKFGKIIEIFVVKKKHFDKHLSI
jgi:hypothetical protein